MNKKLRIILIVVLACVFLGCAVQLVRIQLNYKKGDALYADAQTQFVQVDPATVTVPEHSGTPVENAGGILSQQGPTVVDDTLSAEDSVPDLGIDFVGLAAVNPDIVGWLWIPGTEISYPLLRGADNDSYLYTAYDGEASSFGSIFLDYRCQSDFDALNTVIYGHNMKNGSMFGSLAKLYNTADAALEHSELYLFLPDATLRYELFSAYTTRFDSAAYTLSLADAAQQTEYLNYVAAQHSFQSLDEPLTAESRLVTLSTCSAAKYDRFVVVGVLQEYTALD